MRSLWSFGAGLPGAAISGAPSALRTCARVDEGGDEVSKQIRCCLCHEMHDTMQVGTLRVASCPKLRSDESYIFDFSPADLTISVEKTGPEPAPPAHTASCPACGSLCTTSAITRDTVRVELLTSVELEERDVWLLGCECGREWRERA